MFSFKNDKKDKKIKEYQDNFFEYTKKDTCDSLIRKCMFLPINDKNLKLKKECQDSFLEYHMCWEKLTRHKQIVYFYQNLNKHHTPKCCS